MQTLPVTNRSRNEHAASRRRRLVPGRGPVLRGLLGSCGLLLACASTGQRTEQIYARGNVWYQVGALPATWQPFHAKGSEVAFHNRSGGTVAASAQCPSKDDVPLDVLTNHLLFGFEHQVVLGRSELTLDGRQALRTHLRAEFDGVPIELDLIVLKKDGCTYDLQLISAPDQFKARQPDFEAFVRGFTTTPGASGAGER
jgi:hypothetical protein